MWPFCDVLRRHSLERKQTASSLHNTTLRIDPRKSYGARKTPSNFVLLRGRLLRGTIRTKIKAERENEAKDCKLLTYKVRASKNIVHSNFYFTLVLK